MSAARRAPLVLLLAAAGCASIDDDDWRFGLSRSTYEEWFEKMDANEPVFDGEDFQSEGGNDDEWLALFFPAVLLLPVALDVAFLPVTVPRDLCAN